MNKILLIILVLAITLVLIVVFTVGGYLFFPKVFVGNKPTELTIQQLKEFSLKAQELNDSHDFSSVENSVSYKKNIGTYNGRVVQFAFQCWGDVCPSNGAYFITYKDVSRDDCPGIGGFIVEGYSGWGGNTYGGCSPIK